MGAATSTLLALLTGYLLSVPKQALELEHARNESRARNDDTLDLTVNRVMPNDGPNQSYLVLATVHTKAAGGRGVQIRRISYKLFLGQPCNSEFHLAKQSFPGVRELGIEGDRFAPGEPAERCRSSPPDSPVRWVGLPGALSDMKWRQIDTYDSSGMLNGAGPLEPGEAGSSSMQWAVELGKNTMGVVAVLARVQWCEEPLLGGFWGLSKPTCSEDGALFPDPETWEGHRFHWEFSNSALLSLATPIEATLPK